MKFPTSQWLKIIEYRDFFDIPRYFLAFDGGSYWILDAPFDEAKGDYADAFVLRFVGTDEGAAKERFGQQALSPPPCRGEAITLATKCLRFDQTRRAGCFADIDAIDQLISVAQGAVT